MDARANEHRQRIARVQQALAAHAADALLVPSSDPHLSEYLPERWQGRRWLSGFDGSAGTLCVSRGRAALFADSRYWTQAAAELEGSGIELVKVASAAASDHIDWLLGEVARGGSVMVDGQVLGLAAAQLLRDRLQAAGIALRTDVDLLDAVWPDRPALPGAAVYEHLPPFAPLARRAKLEQLRAAMAERGASHHLVSSVDDIAWITNLRGSDVDYNPVFLAHLLLTGDGATLFVGAGKVEPALGAALAADGIILASYEETAAALAALPPSACVLLDPKRVTLGLRERVAAGVIEATNPSTLAKSRKTEAEAGHVRAAMVEDGAAMCEFYAWFEAALARGEPITELSVDEHLSAARARHSGFVGLSFPVIAGFNANGAMPHYRATPASHARIEGDGLLLIDSGAQYLGGTTDITRVWPIGRVSDEMRRDYTLVLKGMIQLSQARFPLGTAGPMLDALARAPLWAQALDYGHGTGHGVGYFLNVHEGPQTISKAVPTPDMAMQPGMITSNEPGLYRPGRWGVRIENLLLTVAAGNEGFGDFLAFETLTLCPIDTRCIAPGMLRADELQWLNAYHATVRERLAPRLDGAALDWLRARTEPI